MITSKQRAKLRSMAVNEATIMQIGKGGLGENLIKTVSDALEARELIKLAVLENCDETPRSAADALAEATGAEVVAVTGRKVVLYRESEKHKKIEL
ncbi:MAG: ribosome assembly RNA-binding protein YhbY [Clostridia bacterium]|nr:ribosome assembly RNA-binding protein YhbY [Clostridia bacterium]